MTECKTWISDLVDIIPDTKVAAILLFSSAASKLALTTVLENLEEPVKTYNKCLKHLDQLYVVLICSLSSSSSFFFFWPTTTLLPPTG